MGEPGRGVGKTEVLPEAPWFVPSRILDRVQYRYKQLTIQVLLDRYSTPRNANGWALLCLTCSIFEEWGREGMEVMI